MEASYNSRCPAVKRLLREARELHEATEEYYAQPLEDNLFEWHFTVRGPPDSDFDGGVYHGRIVMPAEYPMKPPNIIFLTANGRFETNKKICLSISGHHPETWQPSWSIRTALLAIIGFMPTPAIGTIGSLNYTPAERAVLAKRSLSFNCSSCGKIVELLKERTSDNADIQREAREVSSQMNVTSKEDKPKEKPQTETPESLVEAESPPVMPDSLISNSEDNTNSSPASDQPSPQENIPPSESHNSPINENAPPPPPPPPVMETPPAPSAQTFHRSSSGLSLFLNNILITAASVLLIALVIRRIFFLEIDHKEDVDDIVL